VRAFSANLCVAEWGAEFGGGEVGVFGGGGRFPEIPGFNPAQRNAAAIMVWDHYFWHSKNSDFRQTLEFFQGSFFHDPWKSLISSWQRAMIFPRVMEKS